MKYRDTKRRTTNVAKDILREHQQSVHTRVRTQSRKTSHRVIGVKSASNQQRLQFLDLRQWTFLLLEERETAPLGLNPAMVRAIDVVRGVRVGSSLADSR